VFRGRYQLGDEAILGVQCVDGSEIPTAPDAAPTFSVYNSAGTKIVSDRKIPPKDRANATGLFEHFVRLGSDFTTGLYTILYKWATGDGAFSGRSVDHLEIIAGGSVDGTVIAMHYYAAQQANFIVQHTDAGLVKAGKNPRV
jgi:hypothetical protein